VPVTGVAHLNRGDVLTFFAAISYAVHIILVGEYAREHSAAALSVLQVLACAVMAWLTAIGADAIRWQPMRFASNSKLWIGITVCALFATAVALTPWRELVAAFHPANLITIVATVSSLTATGYFVGRRLGMYPVDAAIVNATHSGLGGTGDVMILTAAERMELFPFAQVATRIGGAITVTLTLIALSRIGMR